MKRYLTLWIVLTLALVMAVAVVNAIVDPYGLFRWVDRSGFNARKPKAGVHGSLVKAYQVLRIAPRTLVMGNSRAEVGFDPQSAAWSPTDGPVFNAALPGTGPGTTLAYLEHVIAGARERGVPLPKAVVWGIDFSDFLNDPRGTPRRGPAMSSDRRLLSATVGVASARHLMQQLRDDAEAVFTLGAFLDSLETLASQNNPYAATLTPLGFNPLKEYVRFTAEDGARAAFTQKDLDNTRAYLRRPKSIFDASGDWSGDLEDLRLIIDLCRRNGIALTMVIYPLHAHLMETIRTTGHWDEFEDWKRVVVRTVAEEARASGGAPLPVWDFSGFNRYTDEAIPPEGDRRSTMRWFWEGGHFTSNLGNVVLARVFGRPDADPTFGVLIDPANIETQLAAIRAQELAYRQSDPDEVARVERITATLSGKP